LTLSNLLTFRHTLFEWIANIVGWAGADGIVVVHPTLGVESAILSTGIRTLLVDAGQMLGTLRADHTFGSALGRSSEITNLAAARGMSLNGATDAIGSTRIRLAHAFGSHNWHSLASFERITLESSSATARGQVIYHCALRISSTGSCAGIATVLLDTGQRRGTLRAVDTFRTTSGAVRIAIVGLNAGTASGIIVRCANSVLGTRIRVAWIDLVIGSCCNLLGATDEGISLVVIIAATVGGVRNNRTTGIVPADVGTRILAFLLDAGLVRRTLTA